MARQAIKQAKSPQQVSIYCQQTRELYACTARQAELVKALEGLQPEDQARMVKMARHMIAGTWPHSLDATPSWTPEQFKEAVDALPEFPEPLKH